MTTKRHRQVYDTFRHNALRATGLHTPSPRAGLWWSRALVCTALAVATTACQRNDLGSGRQAGPAPRSDAAQLWVTLPDRSQLLQPQPDISFSADTTADVAIEIDDKTRYQVMTGFGAALTDASAWLLQNRMSQAQRDSLLNDLFGRDGGIGLSFVRLTIGASDFSRTHYTFDDVVAGVRDTTLAHFSITPNRSAVLPIVKRALAINPQLTVMATPWSAPAWMKTTGRLAGGSLREDAYSAFAEYLQRYVAEYEAEGVPINLLSLQNEPHHEPPDYPGMRLTPQQRAVLLRKYVGPLLSRRHPNTQLLEWDHNWDEPESPLAVLADSGARRYVQGVAWHCYAGEVGAQSTVREAHPDKDVYFTECSGGTWAPNWGDNLAWNVSTLIVGATRNWARGVLLWNLALDERHGPHLGGCKDCRGVVTIDSATGKVTRNEEYYALAHASRFVRPGAHRIASTQGPPGVASVAFQNADDTSTVLLAVNTSGGPAPLVVRHGARVMRLALSAGAVATLVWR